MLEAHARAALSRRRRRRRSRGRPSSRRSRPASPAPPIAAASGRAPTRSSPPARSSGGRRIKSAAGPRAKREDDHRAGDQSTPATASRDRSQVHCRQRRPSRGDARPGAGSEVARRTREDLAARQSLRQARAAVKIRIGTCEKAVNAPVHGCPGELPLGLAPAPLGQAHERTARNSPPCRGRRRQRLPARPRHAASTPPAGSTACSPGAVPADELVAMKLNALVVDLSLLGSDGWDFLERVSGMMPGLGDRRLHPAVDHRPARSRPAARGRRLDHQAGASRGGGRPDRGRRPPPQAQPAQGRHRPGGRRRGRGSRRPVPGVRLDPQPRPHPARVRAAPGPRRQPAARSSSARTSTSASGATRWLTATARSTSSSASCAPSSRSTRPGGRYIHTHFGVGYRFEPGAGRRRCRAEAAGGRRAGRCARGRSGRAGLHASRLNYPSRVSSPPRFTVFSQVGHEPVTGQPAFAATLLL